MWRAAPNKNEPNKLQTLCAGAKARSTGHTEMRNCRRYVVAMTHL